MHFVFGGAARKELADFFSQKRPKGSMTRWKSSLDCNDTSQEMALGMFLISRLCLQYKCLGVRRVLCGHVN